MLLISVLLWLTAIACIVFLVRSGRLIAAAEDGFAAVSAGCAELEAVVLDVQRDKDTGKKVMILQFRIEEEKRTVVIRCTEPFYRKYSRGDKVNLLFREEQPRDFSILPGDNLYKRRSELFRRLRVPCGAAAVILTVLGIIFII